MAGKGWQEPGKQGTVCCAATAQVELDMQQLLPGPWSGRVCRLCVCTGTAVSCYCRVSLYTPPSSLPKQACTHRCAHLESVLYPHRSHPAGWRHYGGRQSGSGLAVALNVTAAALGDLEGSGPPLPAVLSQEGSWGFVSSHGAHCITCLLVRWAGVGKEPVGRTVLRGFALHSCFLALGKLCKQGAAPHPVLLSAWPPRLP